MKMTEKKSCFTEQELDPDFAYQHNMALVDIRKNLENLIDPANYVVGAAGAIGDAFGNSFKQVITGQESARQALANFFSSVADHFSTWRQKLSQKPSKCRRLNLSLKLLARSSQQVQAQVQA